MYRGAEGENLAEGENWGCCSGERAEVLRMSAEATWNEVQHLAASEALSDGIAAQPIPVEEGSR